MSSDLRSAHESTKENRPGIHYGIMHATTEATTTHNHHTITHQCQSPTNERDTRSIAAPLTIRMPIVCAAAGNGC